MSSGPPGSGQPLADVAVRAVSPDNARQPQTIEVEVNPTFEEIKRQIIEVVAADPESKSRAESWLSTVLPDGAGVAGSLRNLGYIFIGADPSEADIAAKACTGIAEATSTAIDKGIKDGRIKGVKSTTTESRQNWGFMHHTATLVVLNDGREFMFDWHATLNIRNPDVRTKAEWMKSDPAYRPKQ